MKTRPLAIFVVIVTTMLALLFPINLAEGHRQLLQPDRHALASEEDCGWTWQNPLPQGNDLNAIWGSSADDIFAVGDYGTILHHDGIKWRVVDSLTTSTLIGIWGSSSSDVFAVGLEGTICLEARIFLVGCGGRATLLLEFLLGGGRSIGRHLAGARLARRCRLE